MFVKLTQLRNSAAHHGPGWDDLPGPVIARAVDIRAVEPRSRTHTQDVTGSVLTMMDGRKRCVAETPDQVAELIEKALPGERSIQDIGVVGSVTHGGNIAVNGEVAHSHNHHHTLGLN